MTILMEMLRTAAEWRVILYCLIILVTILFRPSGVFGSWEFGFLRENPPWKGDVQK